MNTAYFIFSRISSSLRGDFSHTAHRFAIASVAVGLAASIVSLLIMRGFQHTVEDKIYRFGGHLAISKLTLSNAAEGPPLSFNIALYRHPAHPQYSGVSRVEETAYKSGLIRTDRDALGVLFKGVGSRFDRVSFADNMVAGSFPVFPDSGYARAVVISGSIADKIDAQVGDDIVVHFFQDPPRFRRLRVSGIYETNLSEYFDDKIILGDLRLIQRLNQWTDSTASSLEVYLRDARLADAAYEAIGRQLDYDLYIEKTRDKYAEVFEWLALIGRQVNILLAIIFVVICVNLIAIVLILAMERTRMVGILKAMGAPHRLIRSIFLYSGLRLIVQGLAWGNLLGLGLCFIQDRFHLAQLNPRDYYMRFVPIYWDWQAVLAVNLLLPIVVGLALWIPAAMAARTDPIKAIRFA